MLKKQAWIRALGALTLLAGPSGLALAEEEATVGAFSVWQGRGHLFETGSKELTFVGALSGTVYIETEKGPLASGQMNCPAIVTINTDDGSQSGTGRCVITAKDGARVFADISCAGFHLIGCDGNFELSGGTGRFDGITGGGRVVIRSEFGEITAVSQSSAQEAATGIMYLRELRYRIP